MVDKANCLTTEMNFYQYLGKADELMNDETDNTKPIRLGKYEKSKSQGCRVYSVKGKSVCLQAQAGGGGKKLVYIRSTCPMVII